MNNDAVILIIDSNDQHAGALAQALGECCVETVIVNSAQEGLESLQQYDVGLIIADLDSGADINGLDLLKYTREHDNNIPFIITTSNATIDSCKQAIRNGALDYLEKPVDLGAISDMVRPLFMDSKFSSDDEDFVFHGIRSRSAAMQRVFHVLRRVSPTDIGVLIEGESGTGKELTARAIHDNSRRSDRPFMPINCAGLTETLLESELFGHTKGAFTGAEADRKGLFEAADKGTLFLDEIGDMPLAMQAKLLRVLEDGVVVPVGSNKSIRVDVRVISATNHNLAKLVEEKKFRQDLYFRIKGVSVTLPPLRRRPEDIPELFGYFLKEACRDLGRDIHQITEAAMTILVSYDWPGNIRQLRHAVRTMVVMCDDEIIDVHDIPVDIHHVKRLGAGVSSPKHLPTSFVGKSLEEVERMHIEDTLRATDNNRAEAAKILKIGERTLYRKIKEYGL